MTRSEPSIVPLLRCPDCDLQQTEPRLVSGTAAHCSRCGTALSGERTESLTRALSLTVAAAIAFLVANSYVFMTFEYQGRSESSYILTGILELYRGGFPLLAVLIGVTSVLAPAVYLAGMLYVLVPLELGRRPPLLGPCFRWLRRLRRWAMLEVYLLGVIVAVVKLGQLASVSADIGVYAFAFLVLAWTAANDALDPRIVWAAIEPQRGVGPDAATDARRLLPCGDCAQLCSVPPDAMTGLCCSRCGSALTRRKADSIHRTWALLIAAAILYVPANYYPVLEITILGQSEADTILTGVEELFAAGMWEIGALVFFASITVPLLKLLGLAFLLISVELRSSRGLGRRTSIYRIVEYIGRWSMLDMFMVSILVALVQLGTVATIAPGIGAPCFAAVVVITMFAATSFDPRVIWDRAGENPGARQGVMS